MITVKTIHRVVVIAGTILIVIITSFILFWITRRINKSQAAQKEAEEALNESEQLFRYIAEFFPLPLAIVEENGNYEYLNPKFTEVFGYTLADVPTGKKWFELAYPDPLYRREVIEVWKKDLNKLGGEVIRPRTFTVTCKDGSQNNNIFDPVFHQAGLQQTQDDRQRRYRQPCRVLI